MNKEVWRDFKRVPAAIKRVCSGVSRLIALVFFLILFTEMWESLPDDRPIDAIFLGLLIIILTGVISVVVWFISYVFLSLLVLRIAELVHWFREEFNNNNS